jgi:hypothetical protein
MGASPQVGARGSKKKYIEISNKEHRKSQNEAIIISLILSDKYQVV